MRIKNRILIKLKKNRNKKKISIIFGLERGRALISGSIERIKKWKLNSNQNNNYNKIMKNRLKKQDQEKVSNNLLIIKYNNQININPSQKLVRQLVMTISTTR